MRFLERATDDRDAASMLTDYFGSRELGFTNGRYLVVRPDPASFRPPAGVFLVVEDDGGAAVGCGGIRSLGQLSESSPDPLRFEVKHLWLAPGSRGHGWGRALLGELEKRALSLGGAETVLDTNSSLEAAAGLYVSAGYRSIPPYNDNPNATNWYAKIL